MKELSIDSFKTAAANAEILDSRPTGSFKAGFIPGSQHVPFSDNFIKWLQQIMATSTNILLIAEAGKEAEVAQNLQENGYNVQGWLNGGFDAWTNAGEAVDMIIDVEADELMMDIPFDEKLVVVDVRQPMEYAEGHLKNAVNIPLSEISDPLQVAAMDETSNMYLHCGGGTRSVIAASLLKKHGLHNLYNVAGGWKKIKEQPKAEIVKDPDVLN